MEPIDGFWLPQGVRERVLGPSTAYTSLSFAQGRPCQPEDEGATTVRWPVLDAEAWTRLLVALRANRPLAPRGQAFWDRFLSALQSAAVRLGDPADRMHDLALVALPAYTGYSPAMVRFALGLLDLWALERLPTALRSVPDRETSARWQPMGDLPGRLRFYGAKQRPWPGLGARPLFGPPAPPALVVGYGAGNVPGTALLIAVLSLSTALAGGPPPVVVVKNSRREPILAPLVLAAIEAVDPALLATTAVLVWDYEEPAVQKLLLSQADLVVAAAGDETISQIGATLGRHRGFHAHGHKVSFSAIGRQVLTEGLVAEPDGAPLLDVVALLAALDSALWDQHGCLSARLHFVEDGGPGYHRPLAYAARLAAQLSRLSSFIPRGAWPRSRLHDRFDRYKSLEGTGQVQVLSDYDDDFVVVVDARSWDAARLQSAVNDCEGRVVIVRPVDRLMDVPDRYLRLLPEANLQSLSVAVGQPGEGLTDGFLRFAEACGTLGVTAIRTVGRAAFPQLAYSWDGLIPLDLIRPRRAGRFATIEFEAPYEEMLATYRLVCGWGFGSLLREMGTERL